MQTKNRGVTLIELVVVVAILALLASIAVPSYRQYVLRSNRAEAKAALLNLAAAQEKFYLQNNTYTNELTDAPPSGLGLGDTTETGLYTIEVDAADDEGFTATATATGTQAQDSRCAEFGIDQAGARTATSADCW
jgi:type IV pilus assembly protein PilE